jgi:hypothetical protein
MKELEALRAELDDLREPSEWETMRDINRRNQDFFVKLAEAMIRQIEMTQLAFPGTILQEIIAIENKVGINNSDDPESLDYRIRQLERKTNGLNTLAIGIMESL